MGLPIAIQLYAKRFFHTSAGSIPSHLRPLAQKESAVLRILTWRPARRRLESWLIATFDWILAWTRRRLSRLGTSSTVGGRPFVSTKSCSISWSVLRVRARPSRPLPSPNLLPRRRHRRNPKEKLRKRPRARPLPLNRARRPRKNQRLRPTGKWACSSG